MATLNITARRETAALRQASVRFAAPLSGPALEIDLAEVVRRGQDRHELRADTDAVLVGQVLAAGYFATVLRWIGEDPAPFALDQRLAELAGLILGGLLPPATSSGS